METCPIATGLVISEATLGALLVYASERSTKLVVEAFVAATNTFIFSAALSAKIRARAVGGIRFAFELVTAGFVVAAWLIRATTATYIVFIADERWCAFGSIGLGNFQAARAPLLTTHSTGIVVADERWRACSFGREIPQAAWTSLCTTYLAIAVFAANSVITGLLTTKIAIYLLLLAPWFRIWTEVTRSFDAQVRSIVTIDVNSISAN